MSGTTGTRVSGGSGRPSSRSSTGRTPEVHAGRHAAGQTFLLISHDIAVVIELCPRYTDGSNCSPPSVWRYCSFTTTFAAREKWTHYVYVLSLGEIVAEGGGKCVPGPAPAGLGPATFQRLWGSAHEAAWTPAIGIEIPLVSNASPRQGPGSTTISERSVANAHRPFREGHKSGEPPRRGRDWQRR